MSLKETINKLKVKIASILGITILAVGGVTINVNIQTEQFYEDLANGKLEVNIFNQGAYKEVANGLADKMDAYLLGGEPMSYQAVQIYLKMVSKEAGKDDGWTLKSSTQEEFLQEMNDKLKKSIK